MYLAIEVQVTGRESVDGWSKYRLIVLAIYKRDAGVRLHRGEQSLWIAGKRTACKCPKIRVGKRYLILGLQIIITDLCKILRNLKLI